MLASLKMWSKIVFVGALPLNEQTLCFGSYLKFVTKFTNETCKENVEKFQILYMTDVENSEITLQISKFFRTQMFLQLTLFCCDICFFCVEKICGPKLYMWRKMTNMRYV